jgi:hypothetical protein
LVAASQPVASRPEAELVAEPEPEGRRQGAGPLRVERVEDATAAVVLLLLSGHVMIVASLIMAACT